MPQSSVESLCSNMLLTWVNYKSLKRPQPQALDRLDPSTGPTTNAWDNLTSFELGFHTFPGYRSSENCFLKEKKLVKSHQTTWVNCKSLKTPRPQALDRQDLGQNLLHLPLVYYHRLPRHQEQKESTKKHWILSVFTAKLICGESGDRKKVLFTNSLTWKVILTVRSWMHIR